MLLLRRLGLLLALPLVALALVPTAAHAADPATLTLTAVGADVPTRVPTAPDDEYPAEADVSVASDVAVSDATYTTSVDGVTVHPASGEVGPVTPGHDVRLRLGLAGVTPGIHALTVTVSGPDVTTASTTFPFLWVPGGQAVTATDSLAGHVYELTSYPLGGFCEDCSVKKSEVVWFVDKTHVYDGNPVTGRPRCPGKHCQTYHFDASTGLVQIGTNELGRFDATHALLIAEKYEDIADEQTDTVYPRRLVPLGVGHVAGSWAAHGDSITPYDVQLRLARNGTYHLRDRLSPRAPWRGITGRYRIGADRALHLLSQHRTTQHHRRWPHVITLLAVATPAGTRDKPAGVWLAITHGGDDPYYDQDQARGYALKAHG